MATKRAKSTKKVKDLDPKGRGADVKGGRLKPLRDNERAFLRRVGKKVDKLTKDATDI